MRQRIDGDNAAQLLAGHDLVIDGSDNFATRLAVSDGCVALGIPLVSAAAIQFQGQVGLFRSRPCYRCFVGDAFDSEDCDNCAELGVIGALTGDSRQFRRAARDQFPARHRRRPGRARCMCSTARSWRGGRSRIPADPDCRTCGDQLRAAATRSTRRRAISSLVAFGPILDPFGADQVDAVAIAAHHVARHIVDDDPVGSPWRRAWRRHWRGHRRFRQRSRSAGAGGAACARARRGYRDWAGSGGPAGRRDFLSLRGEGSTRQSATAATRIAQSAGKRGFDRCLPFPARSRHRRESTPAGV